MSAGTDALEALGWSLVDNGVLTASTNLVLDPDDGVTWVIAIDVLVPGPLLPVTGIYYWTKTFPGPYSSAKTYYTECEFRRDVIASDVGDLSGFVMEGQANVHSWSAEGESGYVTTTGQTIAGANASKYLRFGYFDVVNGEQFHHEVAYLKSLRIVEVGCTQTVPDPDDGQGTDPGTPGDSNPGDTGSPPPTPPPASNGRALVLWNYQPRFWYGFAPFNGLLATPWPKTPTGMTDFLDACRAGGMKAVVNVVDRAAAKSGGVFSQALWLAQVNLWAGVDISSYTDVILGIMVIDEPNLATTSGWGTVIPYSVVDGVLAKRCSELFPGHTLFVRSDATRMEASGRVFQYVTGCWPTFQGVRRSGLPTLPAFMAQQVASQVRMGLPARVWGMNSRTGDNGNPPSPAQVQTWGVGLAKDKGSNGIALWAGSGPSGPDEMPFTAAYIAAWQAVLDEINRA